MNASEMMNSTIVKNLAAAYIVPALLTRVKLRWIALGVIAYYGLKILSEKGVLPDQAHKALDAVDHGIDLAKEKIGFSKDSSKSTHSTTSTSSPVH